MLNVDKLKKVPLHLKKVADNDVMKKHCIMPEYQTGPHSTIRLISKARYDSDKQNLEKKLSTL